MFHIFVEFFPSLGLMGLKLLVVTGLSSKMERWTPNVYGRWLASWLAVHVALVAIVLILSVFRALTPIVIWILFFSAAALLKHQWRGSSKNLAPTVGEVVFLIIFCLMLARASIAQEFTADAQSYGLVRLGLWMNYQSVLVHMPTEQLNIFTNEWNGELIALVYGLAAHSIQGFMLGNVEILLILFVAAGFLSEQLGATRSWSSLVALLVASTPAVLGITGSMKGDSLAVAATLMAAGWLLSFKSHPNFITLSLICVSAVLASSSKITAGPVSVLIVLTSILISRKTLTQIELIKGLGIALITSMIIASRFTLNWIFYGNPLQRTSNETTNPGWDTLIDGLTYIGEMTFRFSPRLPGLENVSWLLAGGLGVAAFAALALIVHQAVTRPPFHSGRALLIFLSAIALIAELWAIPTPPYAFRYFLPMTTLILVCLCSFEIRSRRARLWLPIIIIMASITDFLYMVRPGEVNANRSFSEFVALSIYSTPLQRSILQYPPLLDQYGINALDIDNKKGRTIAVHALLNRPIASLMGSKAQNKLVYFADENSLLEGLENSCFDLVALSKMTADPLSLHIKNALQAQGFEVVTDGDLIAMAKATTPCASPS